jgi:hypothetical protein
MTTIKKHKMYSPTRKRYSPVAISDFNKKVKKLMKYIHINNINISKLSYSITQIIEISEWCRQDIFQYIINYEKRGKKGGVTPNTKELKARKEHNWGNYYRHIITKDNKFTTNWTTCVGENFVKDILILLGHTQVIKPNKRRGHQPDLMTNKGVFEVKSRTWGTSGTAGEKIYGVPWKYSEVPRLFGKPLYIVLVAAQEERDGAEELFSLLTPDKLEFMNFYKKMNIQFVKLSDILKLLGL